MKVWSVVVQRELNSLPECLLVCNLVVIEWTAAITGDRMGLFQDLSPKRKILENHFRQRIIYHHKMFYSTGPGL
jgi:hypothetical protein